jgi:hypothetical protein
MKTWETKEWDLMMETFIDEHLTDNVCNLASQVNTENFLKNFTV